MRHPDNDEPMDSAAVETWTRGAAITELRLMMAACDAELRKRSFVCKDCGNVIGTALPKSHPDHVKTCPRYASMVIY